MKEKNNIVIIGATGFIGSNLASCLIKQKIFKTLTLISRRSKPKLQETSRQIRLVQCDHLDFKQLQKTIAKADIIFDTAGLAWQHPGLWHSTRTDLLLEQIVQNTLSAYMIGTLTKPDQVLVWISTNAVDVMKAELSSIQNIILEKETDRIVESILSNKKLLKTPVKALELFAWNIIYKHILHSFSYALEFSYAYSKYLGQKILERLSRDNIRILKISDVYGPGQDISSRMIDPYVRARRIQRFVALHNLIRLGTTNWIPNEKKRLHGFYKNQKGNIIQEIRNDYVFPTSIDDILTIMIHVSKMKKFKKTVFELSGKKISNIKMTETIRNFFKTDVTIKLNMDKTVRIQRESDDLHLLGGPRISLLSFKKGLREWIRKAAFK